ncbi:MAG: hypothetical protein ACJA01_000101 [Saprospiraceae bacterium]|jgi:hypothetical protein
MKKTKFAESMIIKTIKENECGQRVEGITRELPFSAQIIEIQLFIF